MWRLRRQCFLYIKAGFHAGLNRIESSEKWPFPRKKLPSPAATCAVPTMLFLLALTMNVQIAGSSSARTMFVVAVVTMTGVRSLPPKLPEWLAVRLKPGFEVMS